MRALELFPQRFLIVNSGPTAGTRLAQLSSIYKQYPTKRSKLCKAEKHLLGDPSAAQAVSVSLA